MSKLWEPIAGPEAKQHGDAWQYFHRSLTSRPATLSDAAAMRHDWLVFLQGWKAKCQQHNDLRKKR